MKDDESAFASYFLGKLMRPLFPAFKPMVGVHNEQRLDEFVEHWDWILGAKNGII